MCKLFQKNTVLDFEGRCHKCKTRLDIRVEIKDQFNVLLSVVPCTVKDHLQFSDLLIPIRSDLRKVKSNEESSMGIHE